MRTVESVQREIDELHARLESVTGTKTEVYSRIVGYYRSLGNWNRGKREEYDHRTAYSEPGERHGEVERSGGEDGEVSENALVTPPDSYLFFKRDSCPNCPAMEIALDEMPGVSGETIIVDGEAGMKTAERHGIFSVPTVIFMDAAGNELSRTTSPQQARDYARESKTATATA